MEKRVHFSLPVNLTWTVAASTNREPQGWWNFSPNLSLNKYLLEWCFEALSYYNEITVSEKLRPFAEDPRAWNAVWKGKPESTKALNVWKEKPSLSWILQPQPLPNWSEMNHPGWPFQNSWPTKSWRKWNGRSKSRKSGISCFRARDHHNTRLKRLRNVA